MTDWPAFLTPTIGAAGLLTLVVLLILWGKLVPRSVMEDLRRDKDAQIATWKAAYERSEEAREIMRHQITSLLEMARTTTHVIEAIPKAAASVNHKGGGQQYVDLGEDLS